MASEQQKVLAILRCPVHDFWAIAVQEVDGGGTRMTRPKCCGRWDTVRNFSMTRHDWEELAEQASNAAEEHDGE